jgi:hypothetical protein
MENFKFKVFIIKVEIFWIFLKIRQILIVKDFHI